MYRHIIYLCCFLLLPMATAANAAQNTMSASEALQIIREAQIMNAQDFPHLNGIPFIEELNMYVEPRIKPILESRMDEFEKTADYNKRIQPLIDNFRQRIYVKLISKTIYDADKEILTISFDSYHFYNIVAAAGFRYLSGGSPLMTPQKISLTRTVSIKNNTDWRDTQTFFKIDISPDNARQEKDSYIIIAEITFVDFKVISTDMFMNPQTSLYAELHSISLFNNKTEEFVSVRKK